MLISDAYAQAAAPAGAGMLMELPLIALVIAIFYFVVIRPQTKRTKDQKAMVEGLQKGDEVVTSGGQLGRITKITESHVVLEVSPEIGMLILKTAVHLGLLHHHDVQGDHLILGQILLNEVQMDL